MNLTNLIAWSVGAIISLAGVHHIDDIYRGILTAQAKLIYESRTETWGLPKFFKSGRSSVQRSTK